MHFWIFSYNRARFLEHCVRTIERCAPGGQLSIFDDDSDDPETREVLRRLTERHEVLQPSTADNDPSKHGGLYANMQAALDRSEPDQLVCFLQDDTQLVREIGPEEIAALERFFRSHPRAGFVQPAFLRGYDRRRDAARTGFDAARGMYRVDRHDRSAGTFYSDIHVAHAGRLQAAGWQFRSREAHNEQQAREHFEQMTYLRDPFAAWLPNPPAFRGRRQTLGMRLASRRRRCGFHPLRRMSAEERETFLRRDPAELPYAEDFLRPKHGPLPEPWVYYPLQGGGWMKLLHNLESRLLRSRG